MSLLRAAEEAVSRGGGYRRTGTKPRYISDVLKLSRDIFLLLFFTKEEERYELCTMRGKL